MNLIQKARELFDLQKDGELQVELIKMIVEHNKEYIFDYDCITDVATIYEIRDKKIHVKEIYKQYRKNNLFGSKMHKDDQEAFEKAVLKCLEQPTYTVVDVRYQNNDGEYEWNRVYLVSTENNNKKVSKIAGRFMSIHSEKLASEIIRMEAERDSLTGIYNHKNYEILCKKMMEDEKNDVLFMMIDLDDFKEINDKHGHYIGDVVLKRVAEVLAIESEGRGIAGRMGGDEFSICLTGIDTRDKAMQIVFAIKDALKTEVEGVTFTVSMGGARTNGRKMDFNQLYFEADEAVYFAKGNGKNQIILKEDIIQKEQKILNNYIVDEYYSEAELELDQRDEYQVIIDADTKKILYVNKAAREILNVEMQDLENVHCYELFKNQKEECRVCNLFSRYVNVAGKNECGLSKYIPNGKFIIKSRYMPWKGKPARKVSFFDINNKKHVEECLLKEMELQDTFSKCWSLILDSPTQDVDYRELLGVLNGYYNADCILIAPCINGKYSRMYESHKESAKKIIKAFHDEVNQEIFAKLHPFYGADGFLTPQKLLEYIVEYPEVKEVMKQYYIRDILGIKLLRGDQFVGQLLVINPRHHVNDCEILQQMKVYFTTDLLRRNLLSDEEYIRSHDILTRLWNRDYFAQWKKQYEGIELQNLGVFTICIADLGKLNQDFGYDYGNKKLVEVAELFRSWFNGHNIFKVEDEKMLVVCFSKEKDIFYKRLAYAKENIEEIGIPLACGFAWREQSELTSIIKEAEEMLEQDKKRVLQEAAN